MDSRPKHTYVPISGWWYGGWVWRDEIRCLRNLGHAVTAPMLAGRGERRHNGTDDTDLNTHIDDVIAHIEMDGLRSVTLVGWSDHYWRDCSNSRQYQSPTSSSQAHIRHVKRA
jgi:hypothetical protein